MDKQTFYSELSERLVRLEVGRDYIERHLKQFDGYFEGKSEDEIMHEIDKLGDLDRVAARIKRMTDKIQSDEAAAKTEAPGVQKPQETKEEKKPQKRVPIPNITPDQSIEITDEDEDVFVKKQEGRPFVRPEVTPEPVPTNQPELNGKRRGSHEDNYLNRITDTVPDEETIKKNRTKFWIIFAATSPIIASILAATAAVFALIFFAIAIMIILAVAMLVAVTAIGTLVSLFGLIFGAAQMLASLPIGLYECGLAIMIGSAAMFVGILIYNFAIRLLPFAAHWLLVFMRYVFKKYRQLFVFLKKEVIGL